MVGLSLHLSSRWTSVWVSTSLLVRLLRPHAGPLGPFYNRSSCCWLWVLRDGCLSAVFSTISISFRNGLCHVPTRVWSRLELFLLARSRFRCGSSGATSHPFSLRSACERPRTRWLLPAPALHWAFRIDALSLGEGMANGECCGDVRLLRTDESVLDVCRDFRSSAALRRKVRWVDGDILGSDWIFVLGVRSLCGACVETNGKRKGAD